MQRTIDATDLKILETLSADGRIQNVDLAKKIGIAPSATLNRVKRLEEEGVIRSYSAKLNEEALGLGLVAFIAVKTNGKSHAKAVGAELGKIPFVLEVHHVAGDYCFLVKVRTAGTKGLGDLLHESISKIVGVESTSTTIALSTFKESISPNLKGLSTLVRK